MMKTIAKLTMLLFLISTSKTWAQTNQSGTGSGYFDRITKLAEYNIFLPKEDPKNPYVFGPFYNLSTKDRNVLLIYVNDAKLCGVRFPDSDIVKTIFFSLEKDVIQYTDGEIKAENFKYSNEILVILYHQNVFNFGEVQYIYSHPNEYVLTGNSTCLINSDVDKIEGKKKVNEKLELQIPKRVCMGIVKP